MKRKATAIWQGSGKEGKGNLTTESNVLNSVPYSFKMRFEEGVTGTNPEELIAAAHAGCFTMKLSFNLDEAGFLAEKLETKCEIKFENGTVTGSHLTVKADVKDISKEKFAELVKSAEETCPIFQVIEYSDNFGMESQRLMLVMLTGNNRNSLFETLKKYL